MLGARLPHEQLLAPRAAVRPAIVLAQPDVVLRVNVDARPPTPRFLPQHADVRLQPPVVRPTHAPHRLQRVHDPLLPIAYPTPPVDAQLQPVGVLLQRVSVRLTNADVLHRLFPVQLLRAVVLPPSIDDALLPLWLRLLSELFLLPQLLVPVQLALLPVATDGYALRLAAFLQLRAGFQYAFVQCAESLQQRALRPHGCVVLRQYVRRANVQAQLPDRRFVVLSMNPVVPARPALVLIPVRPGAAAQLAALQGLRLVAAVFQCAQLLLLRPDAAALSSLRFLLTELRLLHWLLPGPPGFQRVVVPVRRLRLQPPVPQLLTFPPQQRFGLR